VEAGQQLQQGGFAGAILAGLGDLSPLDRVWDAGRYRQLAQGPLSEVPPVVPGAVRNRNGFSMHPAYFPEPDFGPTPAQPRFARFAADCLEGYIRTDLRDLGFNTATLPSSYCRRSGWKSASYITRLPRHGGRAPEAGQCLVIFGPMYTTFISVWPLGRGHSK